MTAAEILNAARVAGVWITLHGNDLALSAEQQPDAELLDSLKQHKSAIIALLRTTAESWSTEDWREFYNRHVASDGGLSRDDAAAVALECCIVQWLNRNAEHSPAGLCHWCGLPDRDRNVSVPFGTADTGHTWLHPECWHEWRDARRETAITALAAMGIPVG